MASSQWNRVYRSFSSVGAVDNFAKKATSFLSLKEEQKDGGLIRSSALPLCGRNYSFNLVLPPSEKTKRSSDFLLDLQARVGTVTHSIVQKWLGMSGVLYGDWKCPKCEKTKKGKLGTQRCKRCHTDMICEELSLEHPQIKLTGHPDGILFIDGNYVGFELKTKNQRVVDEMKEPIDTHVAYQTACYAIMLYLTRSIKLKEYAIFYLSRDSPWSYKVGYSSQKGEKTADVYKRGTGDHYLLKIFKFKISTKLVKKEIKYVKDVIAAQEKAGKRLLSRKEWGICSKPEDDNAKYCPHKYLCWSPRFDK